MDFVAQKSERLWVTTLRVEGLKHLTLFCWGQSAFLCFKACEEKSASSVILYSSDALVSNFKILYVDSSFLSVIFLLYCRC